MQNSDTTDHKESMDLSSKENDSKSTTTQNSVPEDITMEKEKEKEVEEVKTDDPPKPEAESSAADDKDGKYIIAIFQFVTMPFFIIITR